MMQPYGILPVHNSWTIYNGVMVYRAPIIQVFADSVRFCDIEQNFYQLVGDNLYRRCENSDTFLLRLSSYHPNFHTSVSDYQQNRLNFLMNCCIATRENMACVGFRGYWLCSVILRHHVLGALEIRVGNSHLVWMRSSNCDTHDMYLTIDHRNIECASSRLLSQNVNHPLG